MRRVIFYFLIAFAVALIAVRLRYGGGEPYRDLTVRPTLDAGALETVFEYAEPIGNIAVADNGDLFFTVHPESKPAGNRLLRVRDGIALPFPSGALQDDLFVTPLGITIDARGRLWTIDHGAHGTQPVRLLAFDPESGEILHDERLTGDVAPLGSFIQDVRIGADGRTAFLADASFWRRRPALIVYDIEARAARRVLEGHPAVTAENWLVRTADRDMTFFGGLVTLQAGVDGIAVSPDNEWLYFAAMTHDGLFRVPVAALTDAALDDAALAARVQRFSDKPLSDGLGIDDEGRVYITDIEHRAIFRVGNDRRLETLVRSPAIGWPDGVAFDPAGALYIADSALPSYLLRPREAIAAGAPYAIRRLRPTDLAGRRAPGD